MTKTLLKHPLVSPESDPPPWDDGPAVEVWINRKLNQHPELVVRRPPLPRRRMVFELGNWDTIATARLQHFEALAKAISEGRPPPKEHREPVKRGTKKGTQLKPIATPDHYRQASAARAMVRTLIVNIPEYLAHKDKLPDVDDIIRRRYLKVGLTLRRNRWGNKA